MKTDKEENQKDNKQYPEGLQAPFVPPQLYTVHLRVNQLASRKGTVDNVQIMLFTGYNSLRTGYARPEAVELLKQLEENGQVIQGFEIESDNTKLTRHDNILFISQFFTESEVIKMITYYSQYAYLQKLEIRPVRFPIILRYPMMGVPTGGPTGDHTWNKEANSAYPFDFDLMGVSDIRAEGVTPKYEW